jgi:hypothetical protein
MGTICQRKLTGSKTRRAHAVLHIDKISRVMGGVQVDVRSSFQVRYHFSAQPEGRLRNVHRSVSHRRKHSVSKTRTIPRVFVWNPTRPSGRFSVCHVADFSRWTQVRLRSTAEQSLTASSGPTSAHGGCNPLRTRFLVHRVSRWQRVGRGHCYDH